MLICLVIGFPMALGIAFAAARWRMPLLVLVMLPFWTNLLVRTYAWVAVLRDRGHVNGVLEWLHGLLGGAPEAFEPLPLLYNQTAVMIGLVHVHLPFLVLPLYAAMARLDWQLLEASLDLGASQWQTLRSVLLPLVMPGLATGCLLVFVLALGSFLTPDLLGGTDSMMIGNLIAREFGGARDWPFGAALSFLLIYVAFAALWLRASLAGDRA
jgi:spermidine/putrescine transport system permease protein